MWARNSAGISRPATWWCCPSLVRSRSSPRRWKSRLETAPVVRIPDHLGPAYRLIDNRSAEFTSWDHKLVPAEFAALPTLDDLDLKVFDFAALLPEPLSDEDEEARTNAAALEQAAIHIARPLGLNPATTPILDARLGDGSRVAICVPPASPSVAITVRRFGKRAYSAAQLVERGALPANVHREAERVLHTRRNILVSGGTGSGKTTLLNALIELLSDGERIVAIEDTLELRIDRPNCIRFEARGLSQGAVSIRDLVRHALRHRPDHIVVGEVRGGEAADLLQALNTRHGGSLTTVDANNAESALSRLASCAMQGEGDLPWDVTCRGVVDGIAMVIHMTRREEHMGRTPTRPRDGRRTCRAHRLIAAVRTARLTVGPAAGGKEPGRDASRHRPRGRGAVRRRAPGAGHQSRRRRYDRRRRPPRRGRGLGRAGDPRGDTGGRLPARGRVGRPHPAPLGALGVVVGEMRRRGRRHGRSGYDGLPRGAGSSEGCTRPRPRAVPATRECGNRLDHHRHRPSVPP